MFKKLKLNKKDKSNKKVNNKKKNLSPLEREMLKQEKLNAKKEKERQRRLKARSRIGKKNEHFSKLKSIPILSTITRPRPAIGRNIWLIVLTCILIIGSIVMFTPPSEKINQGLDIQGGLSVVMQARSNTDEGISTQDMEASRAIIENRVNALGAAETSVQVQGNNQILVQIPGMTDSQTALNTIGKTGKLEFARLDSFTDQDVKSKIEGNNSTTTSNTVEDSFGNKFSTGTKNYTSVREGTYTPLISGTNITSVSIGREQGKTDYSVNVKLDDEGTKAFAQATQDLVSSKGKIVIILDGEVQSAPSVQSAITNGEVSITGGYTQESAKEMQTVLQSGSLPVSFTFEQSQVVGPTLGQGALIAGVIVAGIGLLLVMLFLLFFYKGLGLLTAAAMGVFATFYLGILATLSSMGMFSLSLSGLAGVVLTVGMAADSSVLVLERFKEEIRMGRSVKAASKSGVKHAIFTSIDADLVTLVSALCLFFLAAASVKGFGLTLAIGICCDIVMMLIFKAPIIRLLAPKVINNNPRFWGIEECNKVAELA
ncbi:MAG: protein translocase subunit SecD, partial [Enterococcus sp.]|nr:protein translocase subunit SecD [Enterococcus sp.]